MSAHVRSRIRDISSRKQSLAARSYAPQSWLESPNKIALARFQNVQRPEETLRDQFVERILDTEDEILPQFKSTYGSNADRDQQRPIARQRTDTRPRFG